MLAVRFGKTEEESGRQAGVQWEVVGMIWKEGFCVEAREILL
jgi:hypothetical protein